MAKKPALHPYADRAAFERLLLLVTTLLQHPGIGSATPDEPTPGMHDALNLVQTQLQAIAEKIGISLPEYSTHTLRKDIVTLRRYGILEQHMYRWGYYLGTGAMNREELQLMLQALASQAKYQGDPKVRQVQRLLARRLRGLDLELQGDLFYPVRSQLNRVIVQTDPEEMMAQGEHQDTLFHQLELLETAIRRGQAIEVARKPNPYSDDHTGLVQLYPLQLIYHDIAWYLICESYATQHLAVYRMNRFRNYCKVLEPTGRGVELQKQRLAIAHSLLETGWGLFLGEPEEQQAELQGQLLFEKVRVRFYPPVTSFILEGDRRHPKQQLRKGAKDPETGQYRYVDYSISLPPRSLKEFSLWVYRHMENAQVLSPLQLVEQHRKTAQALVNRYS